MRPGWLVFLLLAGAAAPLRADQAADSAAGEAFFESRVRPVLVEKCYSCHSAAAKKLKAGLHLDVREGLIRGGDSGPAIVVGDPLRSRLIDAVSYRNVDLSMPPKEKLSDQQIADLAAWVKMGAPWPPEQRAGGTGNDAAESFDLNRRKREHWAWQRVRPAAPPAVRKRDWPRDEIDVFVLAKLEETGLAPAPDADRRTLLRRVYFDLIGLPPAPEEVESFLDDPSPQALEKVVDRLLASPQFGVRWGRHWLDLVRYAETLGHEFDYDIPNAWRYRDYVVRALNQDVPYDCFVMEHIAGDLLSGAELRHRAGENGHAPDNESIIGTAFWYLGEEVHSPVDVRLHQADQIDNRIDVLGKAFQGLTIACARCHDHKFDAIATADYYALYGILKSTRQSQRAINQQAIRASAHRLAGLKEQIAAIANVAETPLPDIEPRPGDVELAQPGLAGWRTDGPAFARCKPGEFLIGDESRPVAPVDPEILAHSALLSRRLEGALRSPTFVIDQRYLHVRAAGKNARMNVVIDNFVVIRDPIYGTLKRAIDSDAPGWITIDLAMWQGHEVYLELVDMSVGDPGGQPGHKDGWAAMGRVILSGHSDPPRTGQQKKSTSGAGAEEAVASLAARYRELEQSIPAPVYVPAAQDGPGHDERIFIRGNPRNPGEPAPRRFLTALGGDSAASPSQGSGRLDLARRIASADNPFTARVMVNRIWHHLFGRGIVASVDNFGVLGEAPSHRALLDHLADRFVREGWSIKRLIRAIMISRTYGMSSRSAPAVVESADPANILLHRQNVRRLEGEAIRDAMLSVSGRLDPQLGGPGVSVHITPFMEGRGRPGNSGPLDGAGRRSLYIEVRRNFLPPMMLAFDTPIPFSSMGRRSVSNVPAQSLILMNDPFVREQADRWAQRLRHLPAIRQRASRMYLEALGRPPDAQELAAVEDFVGRLSRARSAAVDDPAIWADVAHALFNLKEFLFVN